MKRKKNPPSTVLHRCKPEKVVLYRGKHNWGMRYIVALVTKQSYLGIIIVYKPGSSLLNVSESKAFILL